MMNSILKWRNSVWIILVVLLFASCSSSAQVIGPVEEVQGKAYYMHTVEKGQTLYSICKLYKIDINDIVASNPGSDVSLQLGQTLRIPVEKSKYNDSKVTSKGDKSFFVHKVEKKETLYSISKLYNIDINEIIAVNPGADQGLKKGQEVLIPIKKSTSEPAVENTANMKKHTVVSGETLYAIARQYKVTVEAIQAANLGMSEALKEGQIINVPVKALPNDPSVLPPTIEKPIENKPLTIIGGSKKEKYKVGVILPFYSNQADSTLNDREKTFRDASVHLYRGMLLAVDSLKSRGLSAELTIEDVIDTKSSIQRALAKKTIADADLIIGPAFKDAITETAKATEKSGAHMVIPFPLSNKILLSSQNMSKACPSEATQWEYLGRALAEKYKNDHVILIQSIQIDDARDVQVFSQSYFAAKQDSVIQVKVANSTVPTLAAALSKTKKNIVVVPTNDKKTIASVFEALKNTNAIIYGKSEWETMTNISSDQKNKFNIHFPKTIHLDYSDARNQDWIELYRKKYKTEPTDFAVLGYDMMMYYGQALNSYGRDFPNHFNEIKASGLQSTGFNYFKTGNESGFENRHCVILYADEFEYKLER